MKLNKDIKELIRKSIAINDRAHTIIKLDLLTNERLEDIIFEVWEQSVYNNEGVYHLRNEEYYILNDGDFVAYPNEGYACINESVYSTTYEIIRKLLKFESIQPKRFDVVHETLMELEGKIWVLEN